MRKDYIFESKLISFEDVLKAHNECLIKYLSAKNFLIHKDNWDNFWIKHDV